MQDDEDAPRPQRRLAALALESLGIEELRAYIGELRAEITRVEGVIERKQAHRGVADSFFKR